MSTFQLTPEFAHLQILIPSHAESKYRGIKSTTICFRNFNKCLAIKDGFSANGIGAFATKMDPAPEFNCSKCNSTFTREAVKHFFNLKFTAEKKFRCDIQQAGQECLAMSPNLSIRNCESCPINSNFE